MTIQSKYVPIKGMHCGSCTIVIADELSKIPGVKKVTVSLKKNNAEIQYIKEPTNSQIEQAIVKAGYIVGFGKRTFFSRDKSTYIHLFFSLVWIAIFFLLIKSFGLFDVGFSNLEDNKEITALVLGLTAGFSTCMALVGGLILGLSARYAEKHQSSTAIQRFRPHLFFNLGRIIAFFILGGAIGVFGSFFRLSSSITGLLTIGIGIVMLILGLQLTELFPKLANKGITLPSGIAKIFGINRHKQKEYSHKNALILGGLTFFLPCGFTQVMQLVAIGSGSFVIGAMVMGLFAVGTTPGLLGVGGLASFIKGKFAKVFFRFIGALVIILAIYNVVNGFNLTGFSASFFQPNNFNSAQIDKDSTVLKTVFVPTRSTQDITPSEFNVTVGKSYILEVDAKGNGQGCMSTIMIPGVYETPVFLKKGIVQLPFKINKPGSYNITCAMGIVRGHIIATEEIK